MGRRQCLTEGVMGVILRFGLVDVDVDVDDLFESGERRGDVRGWSIDVARSKSR